MKQHLKERAIHWIASHRSFTPVRVLARAAAAFTRGYANYSYNFALNGERRVLERLRDRELRIVFDVGASRGNWTQMARRLLPGCTVHCFEIAEMAFGQLGRRFANAAGVELNPFGLSDRNGTVTLHLATDHDTHTTILEPLAHGGFETASGEVRRGDDYVQERHIDRIDLLKIDVEGAEHLVLDGFRATLAAGRVDVIQFEYGQANKVSHFLLLDYYRLLEPLGYVIGKIYPTGVDFRPYRLIDDDFVGPNYLAVRSERGDLLDALGAS